MPTSHSSIIQHSLYISTASSHPACENRFYPSRFSSFPHTFHGRGDSVYVNSTSSQSALKNNIGFSTACAAISACATGVLLNTSPIVPLSLEVSLLKQLGESTWRFLIDLDPSISAPQWIMGSCLARHILLRPWIAYRVDVAASILRKNPGYLEEQEVRFENAARHSLADSGTLWSAGTITSMQTSRCALVFGSLVGLRTVVALSYARDSFESRKSMADWLDSFWTNANWYSAGLMSGESNRPFLWMDAFGMDGKSETEKQDWAKYSPFIYTLFPVLAYVPKFTERERSYRVPPDDNMKIFMACDTHIKHLARHAGSCANCKHDLQQLHERVQSNWESKVLDCDFAEHIGLDTVCLMDRMRIWPIIERSLAMHNSRLMFSHEGWRLVYATFCLGALAIKSAIGCTANTCAFFQKKSKKLCSVSGLSIIKGIVHQLGVEAEFAVTLPTSDGQENHFPLGRKVKPLNYKSTLGGSIMSGLLGLALPVLQGQIPAVQWRGERYDRKFFLQLADFEPNLYDEAIISATADHASRIERIQCAVKGPPQEFFPENYTRNWLDDRQMTNFDWKMNVRPWYLSRMAPGLTVKDGEWYRCRRVSPVVVKELDEMLGRRSETVLGLEDKSRSVSCPVVPLLVENIDDGQRYHESRSKICIGKSAFEAFVISNYSFQQRHPFQIVYAVEIIVVEHIEGRRTPMFAVTIEGRVIHEGLNQVMKWTLPGDEQYTGSCEYDGEVRKIPLIIKHGKMVSLLYHAQTAEESERRWMEHIPFSCVSENDHAFQ